MAPKINDWYLLTVVMSWWRVQGSDTYCRQRVSLSIYILHALGTVPTCHVLSLFISSTESCLQSPTLPSIYALCYQLHHEKNFGRHDTAHCLPWVSYRLFLHPTGSYPWIRKTCMDCSYVCTVYSWRVKTTRYSTNTTVIHSYCMYLE